MKNIFSRLAAAAVLLAGLAAATRASWRSPINAQTAPPDQSRVWVVVKASNKFDRSLIADAGVSIEEVRGTTVAGVASARAAQALERRGLLLEKRDLAARIHAEEFPPQDKNFHDYPAVLAALQDIAGSNKDLASLVEVGTSLEGRRILGIRFNTTASGAAPSDKPGILFLGTHHAREHLSTEVPLLLAKYLADNRSNPDVQRLLSTRDITIIPLVNPDGSEYDIADGNYKWHRKNKRQNQDGSIGVDLNRNYSYHWGEGGASDSPSDDTYRGPKPFSEPETQAIKAFVESRPNLKMILSYHTYSELILYPWGHTYDHVPDAQAYKAFQNMANQMAQWTGYTPEQTSSLYIASGDTCDWAWGERKIFAFTFELTPPSMQDGGFYPGAGVIESTFQKNIQPALYLTDLADNPYRAADTAVAQPSEPLEPQLRPSAPVLR